jgi:glycosyltransferase involved in cell wall biosynthesis
MTSAHRALDVRIFHKISKSLVRSGYDVTVVAVHPKDENIDGVHVSAIPRSPSRLRRMTLNLYRIYRKTLELDADIYHFHDPELIPVGLLLRLRGKCVVYDAHEDLPRTVSYKEYVPSVLRKLVAGAAEKLELFGARRLTGVIGATPPIADRFRDVNPNTVVVHNFPIVEEMNDRPAREWEERDAAVAYVGGISRERGIFELLDAMNLVTGKVECRLALAGWFSTKSLQSEVQHRTEASNVDFLGLLSRLEIADLLARVRVGIVVLHPEINFINSKPTKLFEYMCAGIPVIASDFPLWREIVESAQCGLLVHPMKPSQIADAIAYLLTHPQQAEEMGRRGRATAAKCFNWKSEEQTLINLYQSIFQQPDVRLQGTGNARHRPILPTSERNS